MKNKDLIELLKSCDLEEDVFVHDTGEGTLAAIRGVLWNPGESLRIVVEGI